MRSDDGKSSIVTNCEIFMMTSGAEKYDQRYTEQGSSGPLPEQSAAGQTGMLRIEKMPDEAADQKYQGDYDPTAFRAAAKQYRVVEAHHQ